MLKELLSDINSRYMEKMAAAYDALKLPEARNYMAKQLQGLRSKYPISKNNPNNSFYVNARKHSREGALAAARGKQEDMGYIAPNNSSYSLWQAFKEYAKTPGKYSLLASQFYDDFIRGGIFK